MRTASDTLFAWKKKSIKKSKKNLLLFPLLLAGLLTFSSAARAADNPGNLSVSCQYGKLTASWSSVVGATYYPIRLSKAGDNNNLIIQNDPYTSTSYTLNGNTGSNSPLAVGAYDFWVHSLDATNNVWSSGVAVKNIQCTAPPAPTKLTASCTNGVITAKWNPVSGVDSYAVRLDYKQDASGNSTNNKSGCTETDGWYCGAPDILSDSYSNNSFSQGGFPDGTYDFWVQTYVSTLPHPTNWSEVNKFSNIVCATDNNCAANTCNTTNCNSGTKIVQGTKVCPDNACAANTCSGTTCWNNLNWIPGTKACPVDNGCAANICATATCNNTLSWVSGTKNCPAPDNGCAANTCTTATCFNGTTGVQGTKVCPVAINGSCGSSNATTIDNAPVANLCTTGTASTVAGSGPWTWTCGGSDGGTTSTCTASKKVTATDNGCAANTCNTATCFNGIASVQGIKVCPGNVDGSCGISNAMTIAAAPTTDLCAVGAASAVSGAGPWTWTCAGVGGGINASCQALKIATDNGCAADTCKSTACWNGSTWANGTKNCPDINDNHCAAETCVGLPCNNGTAWISGTKTCPDNGCAAKTCAGKPCNNGIEWVIGTKTCTDNGCAANTCTTATCDNGIETVAGTKVCPIACTQYAAPICNPGESVATTTFSADGCPTDPKCQPTKPTCPAYAAVIPNCKDGEIIVPGGTDANGCGLPPKCQGNCPVLNTAAPVCKDGETLTLSENDANGCPLPPKCQAVNCAKEGEILAGTGLPIPSTPATAPKVCCSGLKPVYPVNANGAQILDAPAVCKKAECAVTANYVICAAGETKVSGGNGADGCPLPDKCQKIDNGCAANTCSTTSCNNGIAIVKGTKICTDNGCAANTCTTATCWNNLSWTTGTKNCIDNKCTTNACNNTICWNNFNWLVGILPCNITGDNNSSKCTASTTCQASDKGLQTICNGTPGTKQAAFSDHYTTRPLKCSMATCGKTIPTQTVLCTRVDSSNCNNPTACLIPPVTPPTQQCPACFKITNHGTKETAAATN